MVELFFSESKGDAYPLLGMDRINGALNDDRGMGGHVEFAKYLGRGGHQWPANEYSVAISEGGALDFP